MAAAGWDGFVGSFGGTEELKGRTAAAGFLVCKRSPPPPYAPAHHYGDVDWGGGGQQEQEGWSEQDPPRRPQLRAPETLELELELREGQRRVRTRALQALQPMQTAWVSQWRQLHEELRVS